MTFLILLFFQFFQIRLFRSMFPLTRPRLSKVSPIHAKIAFRHACRYLCFSFCPRSRYFQVPLLIFFNLVEFSSDDNPDRVSIRSALSRRASFRMRSIRPAIFRSPSESPEDINFRPAAWKSSRTMMKEKELGWNGVLKVRELFGAA